jgi:Zn-dependent protease with chaperone function
LVLVVLLIPLVMALVWGRRLAALQGETGLPERWLAYASAVSKVGLFCAMAVVALGGLFTLPILLLLLLLSAAGTFSARRKILGESWSLGSYLGFVLRFPLPLAAFWILLAAAPATIASFGPCQLWGGLLFGLVLAIWSLGLGRFVRALMGAREVDGPALGARFAQLVSRSELLSRGSAPVLLQAGPRGGVWAAHFGLPVRRRPFVVVSNLLLEKLDLDELTALLAYDLASIEHHSRGGLFRELRAWLLIATAVCCVPLAGQIDASFASSVGFFWFLFTMVMFSRLAVANQQIVPQLDRRAVELCGDPEALVRALTKVHALSNTPRRWDQEFEKGAAHPSLASRIQAIRQLAGFVPQELGEEVVLESRESGRYAILGPEQVWVLEGVPAGDLDAAALRQRAAGSRAFAYRTLKGLYLKVGIGGRAVLCVAPAEGQEVRLALAADAVARAQSALDAVDGKIVPQASGRSHLQVVAVIGGLLLNMAAVSPAIPAVLVMASVLVLFRREVVPILAAGAVATAAGLLGLFWRGNVDERALALGGSLLALAAGGLLLGVGWRLARLSSQKIWNGYRESVILFTAFTAVALPAAVMAAIRTGRELESVQTGGPLLAVGLAVVVLARYRARRWAQVSGLGLVLAALAPAVLGSESLRPGWDRKLFPERGPEARWVEAPAPARSFKVPADVYDFRISPGGLRFSGTQTDETHNPEGFLVGDQTGQTKSIQAEALAFIDDERLLALKKTGRELTVEELGPGLESSTWQAPIAGPLYMAHLLTDGKRFRVTGRGRNGWVTFDGEIGRTEVHTREAPRSTRLGLHQMDWIRSGDADSALSLQMDYSGGGFAFFYRGQRTLLELDRPGGPSQRLIETTAHLTCPQVPLGSLQYLCVASDGNRSWIWSIQAHGDQVLPLLRLPSRASEILRSGDSLAVRLPEGAFFYDTRDAHVDFRFVRFPNGGRLVAFSARAYAVVNDSDDGTGPATLHIYNR